MDYKPCTWLQRGCRRRVDCLYHSQSMVVGTQKCLFQHLTQMIKLRKVGSRSSIRSSRDSREGRKVVGIVNHAVAATMTCLKADPRRATFPLWNLSIRTWRWPTMLPLDWEDCRLQASLRTSSPFSRITISIKTQLRSAATKTLLKLARVLCSLRMSKSASGPSVRSKVKIYRTGG